jgi:type I restriction enzyme M protein
VHERNGVIVGEARWIGPGVSAPRARFNEVLFIDARGLGHMVSRTNRELSAEDIGRIADTYHAWRGEDADLNPYEDVPGFCAAADLDAIRDHNHVLIPGQYICSEPAEGDGEPLDEKIARLTAGIGD